MMNTYEHGIRKTPTSVTISRMKASRKPWSPSGRNPPGTRSATETAAPQKKNRSGMEITSLRARLPHTRV
ncbi:MAG: hypothetical protein KHX31_06985 [Akkermansia sp.]|uniref:hypothetical protein n=1 Tax=Akkermansia sp. TaxID=1872421 RepID=UPI0025C72E3C|nr:hypothetical protein [Akkermansia sp.]MBS5508363.1 hypothetical protein [Akkermansia sp.]